MGTGKKRRLTNKDAQGMALWESRDSDNCVGLRFKGVRVRPSKEFLGIPWPNYFVSVYLFMHRIPK